MSTSGLNSVRVSRTLVRDLEVRNLNFGEANRLGWLNDKGSAEVVLFTDL